MALRSVQTEPSRSPAPATPPQSVTSSQGHAEVIPDEVERTGHPVSTMRQTYCLHILSVEHPLLVQLSGMLPPRQFGSVPLDHARQHVAVDHPSVLNLLCWNFDAPDRDVTPSHGRPPVPVHRVARRPRLALVGGYRCGKGKRLGERHALTVRPAADSDREQHWILRTAATRQRSLGLPGLVSIIPNMSDHEASTPSSTPPLRLPDLSHELICS
jgi:hypothetical protein